MALKIDQDKDRFQNIVRGKVRKELKNYITRDKMFGRQGNKTVSIPLPGIDTPRFTFDDQKKGGASQGDGEDGDPVAGQGPPKPGKGKAGQDEGEHVMEVEFSIDELADMLGEELQLPRIENKGKAKIVAESKKYNSIQRLGPEGLKNFRRTYKETLKREMSSGTYYPGKPIVPRREDKRFKSPSVTETEITNAAVIWMMDVSGSMGEDQKEIARTISFWANAWIKKHYKGAECRYIIHDVSAKEVNEEEFFRTSESGGTQISSAYQLCADIIAEDYPGGTWNVYVFHYSDGDNASNDDDEKCFQIIRNMILPNVNQFGYGQTQSSYGSGQFLKSLQSAFPTDEKVCAVGIEGRDGIIPALRSFFSGAR